MTVRLSIAIMHHPARAAKISEIVAACAPLPARVIADPEPDGPPSPLRTAKKAWAAVAPGATHHLVLQDDLTLTDGFAEHILAAVEAQPDAAITLYVNWHSTPNSYFVRRAVESGTAWAPLFDAFVPTLGLVLPAAVATELAAYLATVPDDVRHDDRVIAEFCREKGTPVLAAVPHLVEHGDLRSVAGNEVDGDRHAAVFLREWDAPVGYWQTKPEVLDRSVARAAHRSPADFSVEFHNSECRLRFARPGAGEHIWHPFGWYWQDWCSLIGVDADEALDSCHRFLGRYRNRLTHDSEVRHGILPVRLAVEMWAAAYILGFDTADPDLHPAGDLRAALLRAAFTSWIDCGLLPEDRSALDQESKRILVDIGVNAAACGRLTRTEPQIRQVS